MGRNERDFCPFLFPSAVYGAYPSSSPSSTTSPPSSTTSPPPSYSCTHSSSSSLSINSPFAFPSTAEFSSTANFNQQCTEEIEVHGSSNTINFLQEFRLPRPPPAVAPAARHQQPANMSQSDGGFDMNVLVQGAQIRWLKPAEVLFILQNHENYELSQEQAQKPIGGSLFLYNKRVVRFFRRDGHNWRKKKDGRTVGEAHERLKVGNIEALNCYYAHGEQNSNFQRRSYWMLDSVYEHIVLVHYRDICEGKNTAGSAPQLSPSTFSPSPTSYTTQNQDSSSRVSGLYNPYHNFI